MSTNNDSSNGTNPFQKQQSLSSSSSSNVNYHNESKDIDSDFDSMFGDDSSKSSNDEEDMFGDDSSINNNDSDNHRNDGNIHQIENGTKIEECSSTIVSSNKMTTSSEQDEKQPTIKIPRKRELPYQKRSSLIPKKSRKVPSIEPTSNDKSISISTSNVLPSFDIHSYNEYSSYHDTLCNEDDKEYNNHEEEKRVITKVNERYDSSTSSSLKVLEPDQYPKFDIDEFWRIFRSWDFIHDLNQLMQKQPKAQHDEYDNCTIKTRIVTSATAGSKVTNETSQQKIIALPDEFHCHEQYSALWSPLLISEIKAQIISDITTPLKTQSVPLSNLAQPVKVIVKHPNGNKNREENYNEYLTLNISMLNQGRSHKQSGQHGSMALSSSRGAKSVQHSMSRNEFVQNELILLMTEPSFLDQASKGLLKDNNSSDDSAKKKSTYSMMTLLSNASPLINSRLGIVGVVTQRSKSLQSGLVAHISRRLLKRDAPIEFELCLIRLGHCVTGIREFNALCKINEMPLLKYVLSAQAQHDQRSSLEMYKKAIRDNPLSEHGGQNALGIGFRIWVKSKFNSSQQEAINAAAREYGSGGFTLVKGPPGTGKTTTLVAMVNALHLRQYQRYYSEIEKITLSVKISSKPRNSTESLPAIAAAAKVKPRILICAPSNAAVDNIIMKVINEQFTDGNGGKYRPSMVRVGTGSSSTVANVTLDHKVNQIIAEGSKPQALEDTIVSMRKDLSQLQIEIENLQRRLRLLANATTYSLSMDWEIRIDEENFKVKERVLFVNHKLKKVELQCPPPPKEGEETHPVCEMHHYRSCMASLVKYIERHNNNHSKLMQLVLVQNAAKMQNASNYNQVSLDLHQELERHLLDSTHIVLTTLGSAGSKTMENVKKFSVIVIDEAAQSSEPSILPALQLGSSHCVLVGDPQQLPATIFSISGRETKYDRSLFQRLEEGGHEVNMLNVQYRMNPKISSFPRQIFYDGTLLDGPNVTQPSYGGDLCETIRSHFRYFQPLTILDLDSYEEREGTNLSNLDEARLVLHLFSSLDEATKGLSKKSKVAVITPYLQQVVVIKRLFEATFGLSYNRFVEVSTVDSFQGKEANIVILSCVRAASRGVGIGFLSDVQRMNVALTRAKDFLFVITRCRTILVNPYWRDFVAHARQQKAIVKVVPKRVNMTTQPNNMDNKNIGMKQKRQHKKEPVFPNLRFIKPVHYGSSITGFSGDNKHSVEDHDDDGNISA